MTTSFDDLELAFEYVSTGYQYEHTAYLDKESGKIYYDSDDSDDVMPDDLFTNSKYIQIPIKKNFGIGKPLVLKFFKEYFPEDIDTIYRYFSSRGAYSKYMAF